MTRTIDNDIILDNLDLILNALNIEYNRTRGRYFFPCPVHGSDNYSSCSIYQDTGIWRCFTRGCHEGRQTVLGFVAACLKCSHDESVNFCRSAIGNENSTRTVAPRQKIDYRRKTVNRDLIIPLVEPRVEFYLRRGYSQEILMKYDIFLCKKRTNSLYGRIIFPIYDNAHENAVGFVARTLHPQCIVCNKFHSTSKPCPVNVYDKIKSEKWLNSKGFNRYSTLFNYWFAKDFIREKEEVILVEGQGDVMKLEMAGIHNSVGIFGTELTAGQLSILDNSGAKRLYIGTDSDTAGREALLKIQDKTRGKFEVIPLTPTEKDFGEMSVPEIVQYFTSV